MNHLLELARHVHIIRVRPTDGPKKLEERVYVALDEVPAPWNAESLRAPLMRTLVDAAERFLLERPLYAQRTDGFQVARSVPLLVQHPEPGLDLEVQERGEDLGAPLVVVFELVHKTRPRDDDAPFFVRMTYEQSPDDSDAVQLYAEIQGAECEARGGCNELGGEQWGWNQGVVEVWGPTAVELTWKFLSERESLRFEALVRDCFARRQRVCHLERVAAPH